MKKALTFDDLEDPYLAFHAYAIDVTWDYLESWIKDHDEEVRGTTMAPLDLDPDFQRAHVWTYDQQRAYVEYKIRGGRDGGNLLFNCVGWGQDYRGPFVLVDGKQRINAVRKFMAGELAVFPGFWGDGNLRGYFRSDITGHIPIHCNFRIHIQRLPTREEVLRWYLAVNTGGTPHTDREINHVRELLVDELKRSKA